MTIAIVLFPSTRDRSTSTVATHTILDFSSLSWIGLKAVSSNDSAKWSNRISPSIRVRMAMELAETALRY